MKLEENNENIGRIKKMAARSKKFKKETVAIACGMRMAYAKASLYLLFHLGKGKMEYFYA